jgi:hypothetical protein
MSPSTQRNPAKQRDLANGERPMIKTKVLVLRTVSSSDFP